MSPKTHNNLALPTELWLYILRLAVRMSDWKLYIFFPPPEDFALVDGFKNASTECCKLVKTAENSLRGRSVVICCSSDYLKSGFPAGSVRHMVITDEGWRHTGDHTICARHFATLESIRTYFRSSFVPIWSLYTPTVQNLQRLDLSGCLRFLNHPNTVEKLNFPTLVELRLSGYNPADEYRDALCMKTFLLENGVQETQRISECISALKGTLIKLQHLRLLSLHMTFTYEEKVKAAIRYHDKEHGRDNSRFGFGFCKDCTLEQNDEAARLKERMATKELAEALPKLECVRWTDAWRRKYFDEVGQREYEVSRKGNGELGIVDHGVIDESWPWDRYCFL